MAQYLLLLYQDGAAGANLDPKFMQDCFQEDGKSLVEMDKAIDKLASIIDVEPFELSKLLGDRYESRYVKVA